MSDTPETDAWLIEQNDKGYAVWQDAVDFSRKLECERDALRQQMRDNPWCAACKETDCCVSHDGTCTMIRKYLSESSQ